MARPKKPPHVKLMEGGRLMPSRDNLALLQRPCEIPDPPEHLTKGQRSCWHEITGLLKTTKVAALEDAVSLEQFAIVLDEWRAIVREYNELDGKHTYETVGKDGSIMYRAYPICAIKSDADRRLTAMYAKFGMSPSDRARISAPDDSKPGQDPTGRKAKMAKFA